MDRAYGQLIGVDAKRVSTSSDGMSIALAGRSLELIDTPGHARHHHCIWDESSRLWFSGDTFGSSCRDFDVDGRPWAVPITPPTQFDPDSLKKSMQRLLTRQPAGVCITHYGRVDDLDRLHRLLVEQIDAMVAIGLRWADTPERYPQLKRELAALYRASLDHQGVADLDAALQLLTVDVELNAQGLAQWVDRQRTAQ
jgi:glyoxylase-like metal-dependent hydrolase (beta-lactamase superfamily II)